MQRPSPIRTLHTLVPALVGLALVLWPGVALAQREGEGAARALQKKAMEDDYLNTDFDKAADKLNQAIAKCGAEKCGVPLRGLLRRDLATVQAAAGRRADALSTMTEALKIDAGLSLDPNFKTKELEAIFAEAKRAAASGGSSGPPPAGDFTHAPTSEQQVRTPIPIYVEYTGSETLKRVMAKYKGLGMTEWKSLELKSIGNGFGANTACADVQAGDFLYYIQGFNEQNDPVATGGDRQNPYKVVVKTDAVSVPPHLPGQAPPTQCADKGDCPPDFPGCKKGAAPTPAAEDTSLKGEGEACEEDSECKSGTCKSEKCTAPPEDTSQPKRKKFWVGVFGSLDLQFLSSGNDVCLLNLTNGASGAQGTPSNGKGYYCTFNGNDFPAQSQGGKLEDEAIISKHADSVGGGMVPANFRVLAAFDYAINTNMMIGARVGYVVNTFPGTQAPHFPPLHAEARYTYVFGTDPIGKAGIHPIVFGGLGVAPFDASVTVAVDESPSSDGVTNPGCPAGTPASAICTKNVSAWQTGGPFFFEAAGGARWEFVPGIAAIVDLKLVGAVGGSAGFKFVPTPELGVQYGF